MSRVKAGVGNIAGAQQTSQFVYFLDAVSYPDKTSHRDASTTVYWPWAIRLGATPLAESEAYRQHPTNIPLLEVHGKEEGGMRMYFWRIRQLSSQT
jgi:hypothetical protein